MGQKWANPCLGLSLKHFGGWVDTQGRGPGEPQRWPRLGALGAASPDAIGPAGEMLSKPTAVRYDTEMAYHLLRWEPGHNAPSNVSYEVEHKV